VRQASASRERQTALRASAPRAPAFGLPLETAAMEARTEVALPVEPGKWQYEPKWDGFRCLVFKEGEAVELRGKSGKPLGRFFPEIVALLAGLPFDRFVADGELVIETGGRLSFDALQMRLHPAESRIRKLAAETPARLVLFDLLLAPDGAALIDRPLSERRRALETFGREVAGKDRLLVTPATRDPGEAERWLAGYAGTDGVVAKRADRPYESGERTMVKVKRLRTADCVVGGFRYESHSRNVGSLLLGLYDAQGLLDHVGFTATIAEKEQAALTRKLEALREAPGFTGRAPGGPSRWSTERSSDWEPVRPELVVEVRFDHVTGDRFRHGTKLLRWRPDKAPRQCTMDQIAPPADLRSSAASSGRRQD
jgi:ATP-dependent DNA ligase